MYYYYYYYTYVIIYSSFVSLAVIGQCTLWTKTGSLFSCYDTENLILMTIRLCTLAAALQLEVIFCFINFLFVHIQKLLPYHTLGAFHNGIPHQVVYSVRTWNLSSFYITFSEVMKGRFFFFMSICSSLTECKVVILIKCHSNMRQILAKKTFCYRSTIFYI